MDDARENLPSHQSGSTFQEMVAQAAKGSDTAVWELVEQYHKNILRVVRRHLPTEIRSKIDSTDIVQSVWKSFLRNRSTLEHAHSVENFVSYLATMARLKVYETHRHYTQTKAYDIHREDRSNSRANLSDEEADIDYAKRLVDRRCDTPSEIIAAQENWHIALERAGDRGHEIIRLRLQGLTLDEVATRLNTSTSTVRRVLDSVLKSLTA